MRPRRLNIPVALRLPYAGSSPPREAWRCRKSRLALPDSDDACAVEHGGFLSKIAETAFETVSRSSPSPPLAASRSRELEHDSAYFSEREAASGYPAAARRCSS